jgi:pimeloyl-ACP methyl ester carboxylesterase
MGHAQGVAELAAKAGRISGLADSDVSLLRRAACAKDIGQLGVSNTIWDKPGALTQSELERVRLHPYLTERMLSFSDSLAPLGAIAGQHHERLDDEDGGQGEGHWAEYLRLSFHRATTPPGYTFDDLAKVSAPTLILVGDRDDYCTLEDGVAGYRQLPAGEVAVLPDTGHFITPAKIERTIEFFDRHLGAS